MLRQALVDAEKGQAAAAAAAAAAASPSAAEAIPLTGSKHDGEETTTASTSATYGATATSSTTTTTTHRHQRTRSTSSLGDEPTTSTTAAARLPQNDLLSHQSSDDDEGDYYDDDDDDEDEEEDEDDEEDDDDTIEEPELNVPQKLWNAIKAFIRIVANVENLWDTPPSSPQQSGDTRRNRRRNNFVVLFWFVVLASSYAGERSTFKLLVDHAGPFRLVSVQMVTFSHAVMLGFGLLVSHYVRKRQVNPEPSMGLGVPLVDVGLMALLDTVTLLMVFITGFHVSPTLTVLLVQFIIPLTAFLSQFMHPDGRWTCCRPEEPDTADGAAGNATRSSVSVSNDPLAPRSFRNRNTTSHNEIIPLPTPLQDAPLRGWGGLTPTHVWGSLILFLAVALALIPAFYSIANPAFFIYADPIPIRTAINTMTYVSSCIPAAASQLYKEHILLQYKQPVNVDKMNFLLSVFIFIFASIVSPLAYGLQGLGNKEYKGEDWTSLYPSGSFSDNFVDGLQCFFGTLSERDQERKYPEEAECSFTLTLILSHAFCIIAIGVGVDKIVNSGATKVMYRGISAGIILATLCMHFYEIQSSDFFYGPVIDTLNLVCLVLMVLGAEVYHRTTLQESTFETIYQPVEVPTFDDY